MSNAYVQVAPDDSSGKKVQTYENTIGGNDVHAQAVVLVDSTGTPYTPLTSFSSSNIARVDPSGSDSTGTVGDLSKPFLTVQGAINAIQAGSFQNPAVDIGAKSYSEDITTSLKAIRFIGRGNQYAAFNSLFFTEPTDQVSVKLMFVNAGAITIGTTGGLNIDSWGSEIADVTNNAGSIYLAGWNDSYSGGTLSAPGFPIVFESFHYTQGFATWIDSPGSAVTLIDSVLGKLVAAASVELRDSRIIDNAAGLTPTYADVLLQGIGAGGTTGQVQAKASNADFDVHWINSALTPNAAGVAGKILRSNGSTYIDSLPTYPNSGVIAGKIIIADGTNYVESTPTFPNTASAAGKIIRSDGTNFVTSSPTFPNAASNVGKIVQSDGTNFVTSNIAFPSAAPVAGKVLVSDGTNVVGSTPTFPNASATSGKVIQSDGTNWIASSPTFPTAAGIAGKILRSDGTNYLDSVPTLPVAASAISGKKIQSDGTNWIASAATWPTIVTSGKIVYADGTNYVMSVPTFPATASATNRAVIVSDGTNWLASVETYPPPGTNGNLLVSDGTNWTSNPRTMKQSAGSSASGTANTLIASITAAATKQLVNFMITIGSPTTANSSCNINVIYADGTSNVASTNVGATSFLHGNYGGLVLFNAGVAVSTFPLQAKKVVGLLAATIGVGTGTRQAAISAEEIPMS